MPTSPDCIEIHNAIEPRPMTVESFRAERAVAVAALDLLAFDDDVIAGAGTVGWGPTSAESRDRVHRESGCCRRIEAAASAASSTPR